MYAPQLGRFISRDPLGYVDGANPYQLERGNPVMLLDPLGLIAPAIARQGQNWQPMLNVLDNSGGYGFIGGGFQTPYIGGEIGVGGSIGGDGIGAGVEGYGWSGSGAFGGSGFWWSPGSGGGGPLGGVNLGPVSVEALWDPINGTMYYGLSTGEGFPVVGVGVYHNTGTGGGGNTIPVAGPTTRPTSRPTTGPTSRPTTGPTSQPTTIPLCPTDAGDPDPGLLSYA